MVGPRTLSLSLCEKAMTKMLDSGDLNWQLAIFRIACMHPPTLDIPATLLQLREKARENVLFVVDKKTAGPIKISPK